MIWTVIYFRWAESSSGWDTFLFNEQTSAVAYAQELLLQEYAQRNLINENFEFKTEMLSNYVDEIEKYRFLIKVEQKEIG